MQGLEIQAVHKSFGELRVLQGISFHQDKGEILGLLGPSGSGKTTLLEIIAGLVDPDAGDCTWDGISFLHLPPHLRKFGLMFQEYVLFPHKNVAENISFGLKMAQKSPSEISQRVEEALELVGLPGFGGRDVSTLSGGEQQRVALARSLAPEPRLIMLDEPLGALDRTIRERLIVDLKDILKNAKQTTLYVTHDQEEAFSIADRVVILGEGKTAQIGTPREIYFQPSTPYVAQFLGLTNLIPGTAKPAGDQTILKTELGSWTLQKKYQGNGLVLIRPDRMMLEPKDNSLSCQLSGKLTGRSFSGQIIQAQLEIGQYQLIFFLSDMDQDLPPLESQVSLYFNPDKALHFFSNSSVVAP